MMITVMMLKIMRMIMKGGLIKMITTIMCHVRRPNETLQVWNIIMNRGEWSKWWQLLCSRFEGLMVGTHPPLCTSPMIEINGTRAPHPAASQADAYLFQVGDNGDGDGDVVIWWWWWVDGDGYIMFFLSQVKSGGTVQYCKIVCDKGEWRGPYCGHTRETLGGL